MHMGEDYKGKTYTDYLGHEDGQVVIDGDGFGEFPVQGGSVSVWVCQ